MKKINETINKKVIEYLKEWSVYSRWFATSEEIEEQAYLLQVDRNERTMCLDFLKRNDETEHFEILSALCKEIEEHIKTVK